MARSDIIRGPAIIQYEGQTFYAQGDIAVAINQSTFPINASMFGGQIDLRVNEIVHTVSFVPVGKWGALSLMMPYATMAVGASVFGVDRPLTIWSKAGVKRIYHAAAVTGMANLSMASTKTLFQSMTYSCIHKEGVSWSTANSLFTETNEAYPGDSTFSTADIITQPYTCTYGGAPWAAFRTKEGVETAFALRVEPETDDFAGLADMTFQGVDVTATLQPTGFSTTQVDALLKHQGVGAVRGRSLGAGAPDLDVYGTGVFLRLYAAAVTQGNYIYGQGRRVAGLQFTATRSITAGVANPLFYVGTESPD